MCKKSIGRIAEAYGVSTRTLRYYESKGLLHSTRGEGGIRFFNTQNEETLRHILVLRRLGVPLAGIGAILNAPDGGAALAQLRGILKAQDARLTSLLETRNTLYHLMNRLGGAEGEQLFAELFGDATFADLPAAAGAGTPLENEAAKPPPLQKRDVRILTLPPCTVLSVHRVGPTAESDTLAATRSMLRATGLPETFPALRHFSFNHPNGQKPDFSDHGCERWTTIPPHFPCPKGFDKKKFPGGLYAVFMAPFGLFEEWDRLHAFVQAGAEYEMRPGDAACMGGLLEETLNFAANWNLPEEELYPQLQLDLCIPIRPREH